MLVYQRVSSFKLPTIETFFKHRVRPHAPRNAIAKATCASGAWISEVTGAGSKKWDDAHHFLPRKMGEEWYDHGIIVG